MEPIFLFSSNNAYGLTLDDINEKDEEKKSQAEVSKKILSLMQYSIRLQPEEN